MREAIGPARGHRGDPRHRRQARTLREYPPSVNRFTFEDDARRDHGSVKTCSCRASAMTTAALSHAPALRPRSAAPRLGTTIANTWRTLKKDLFEPYRPERHYMRGPGPKWREKHVA